MIRDALTLGLLAAGAFFILVAAVGTLRLPDVFTRMHAITKAGTLGVGLSMAAVAVYFGTHIEIVTRAMAVLLFTLLTQPASAQMMGRAAYRLGVPMAAGSARDDLRDADPQRVFEAVNEDAPSTLDLEAPHQ